LWKNSFILWKTAKVQIPPTLNIYSQNLGRKEEKLEFIISSSKRKKAYLMSVNFSNAKFFYHGFGFK